MKGESFAEAIVARIEVFDSVAEVRVKVKLSYIESNDGHIEWSRVSIIEFFKNVGKMTKFSKKSFLRNFHPGDSPIKLFTVVIYEISL